MNLHDATLVGILVGLFFTVGAFALSNRLIARRARRDDDDDDESRNFRPEHGELCVHCGHADNAHHSADYLRAHLSEPVCSDPGFTGPKCECPNFVPANPYAACAGCEHPEHLHDAPSDSDSFEAPPGGCRVTRRLFGKKLDAAELCDCEAFEAKS